MSFAKPHQALSSLWASLQELSNCELTRIVPKAAQKDVEFCCEAAFIGELLDEFKHSNVADNHICNGVMRKGYSCKANTGGFVWGKGNWITFYK